MVTEAAAGLGSTSGVEPVAHSPASRGIALSVVIPVYNEAENVVALIDELADVVESRVLSSCDAPSRYVAFEIIVVDDGSRDATPALLRRLASERPYLRAVFFRRNFGQAAAFDAGFRAATGEVIVTMDGDLQNDPRDIPAMIRKLDEGYDVVTGWRWRREDAALARKLPSRVANWLIRRTTEAPVHDLGCSLRVYRREVTDELRLYGEMHRFISVLAFHMGARIVELKVNHRARRAGRSKYGLQRTFKVLLDLMTVLFLTRYQTKPTYVFGGLGLVMVVIAVALSAVVLWEKHVDGTWVHRNPIFIIAATSGLVAVQLMATGIIAELVIRTYYESQDKRAYSISGRAGFER
jgi:glycosyltransferase involved in cell wall biosynthesis